MDVKKVHAYVDEKQEEYLDILKKFVRQPSISAQNIGIRECAAMLIEFFEGMGMPARIIETKGKPAVFAEYKSKDKDALTILFYGHYDVQPPEPIEEWVSPPFEPTVRNGRLYGRGTSDNKGQFLAHCMAVKSYLETEGSVPVSVKFILDGEEESGSPNLPQLAAENKELLAADLVYASDGAMHDATTPAVVLGNRGIMAFGVELTTAEHDNHSGNKGGVMKNAGWELVHLLSTMQDKDGNITIDGFYDEVMPMDEAKSALIDKLDFDPDNYAKLFGIKELGLTKAEFYKRLMFLPTLTVNSITCGFGGAGTKTIIPCKARAAFDMRLVYDQECDVVFEKVKAHINKICPDAVVTEGPKMEPAYTDASLPAVKSIVDAVRMAYDTEPVVTPMLGGSLPTYVWTKILGIPAISVPYGNPDQTNHAPNENLALDAYKKGIHATTQVIYEISRLKK